MGKSVDVCKESCREIQVQCTNGELQASRNLDQYRFVPKNCRAEEEPAKETVKQQATEDLRLREPIRADQYAERSIVAVVGAGALRVTLADVANLRMKVEERLISEGSD